MKRQIAVAVLLVAGLLLARPGVEAQQAGKIPRIGIVAGDDPSNSPCVDALLRGLGELGYVEGKTHTLELRWAEGRSDTFPALASDLVRLRVDLIVSAAGPAAAAVKDATSSIPIVLASSFYPVESGIIASLARPGGNVTDVTHFTPELMAKRVQLLKEIVPGASRFAVLRLPGRMQDLIVKDLESAARRLGVRLQVIEVQRVEDLAPAFDAADAGGAQGVMSTQAPLFVHNNAPIARLALKHRLPSLSGEPGAAEARALLFYGPNVFEGCARAARYVDRILKGAKPADLPVEQPTKIELVVNSTTAKALGVIVPQSILARRTESSNSPVRAPRREPAWSGVARRRRRSLSCSARSYSDCDRRVGMYCAGTSRSASSAALAICLAWFASWRARSAQRCLIASHVSMRSLFAGGTGAGDDWIASARAGSEPRSMQPAINIDVRSHASRPRVSNIGHFQRPSARSRSQAWATLVTCSVARPKRRRRSSSSDRGCASSRAT